MEDVSLSRRKFAGASLGLAAAGAIAATRSQIASAAGSVTPGAPRIASLDQPVVAHVSDLAAGTVVLYTGEREVTVVDHDLAQSLARHVV